MLRVGLKCLSRGCGASSSRKERIERRRNGEEGVGGGDERAERTRSTGGWRCVRFVPLFRHILNSSLSSATSPQFLDVQIAS